MASRQDRVENKIEELERSDLTLVTPDASASYLTIVLSDHGVTVVISVETAVRRHPSTSPPSCNTIVLCIFAASSGACVTITRAVPNSRFSSSISSNT